MPKIGPTTKSESGITSMIQKARCRVLIMYPWYGAMAAKFKWVSDHKIDTMGVAFIDHRVHCFYNPSFCEMLTQDELIGVIRHEVEHIIKLHPLRLGSRDKDLFNIACDGVVNGLKPKPRIQELRDLEKKLWNLRRLKLDAAAKAGQIKPVADADIGSILVWMPQDVDVKVTAEELYEILLKDQQKQQNEEVCPKCLEEMVKGLKDKQKPGNGPGDKPGDEDPTDDEEDQAGKEAGENDKPGKGAGSHPGPGRKFHDHHPKPGKQGSCPIHGHSGGLDSHIYWKKSNMSEDSAKKMVREMVRSAGIAAGSAPAHLQTDIQALNKPKVMWRNELRQFMARHAGGKRRTFAKLNRRLDDSFGVKGRSSHAKVPLTIMIDTSGSVDADRLRQFFTEIEAMAYHFKITVIEFTCQAWPPHYRYKRGNWKTLKVKDRGGTNFNAALEYIEKYRIVGRVNIMLSDGECTIPERRAYPLLWAICPHTEKTLAELKNKFPWGRPIYIPAYST